jgi:SEC-C motif
MSRKRISRNAPCPCGSGKKYKHCCYKKGFDWVQEEDGTVGKSIPMTEAVKEVFQQARQAFIDKHGRRLSQMNCSSRTCLTWSIWRPCWSET